MFTKLKSILIENFDWIKKNNIIYNSKINEDLGFDSISLINLQILIEDNFEIRFNPMEDDITEIFDSIDSLISFIEKKKNE